MYTRARPAFTSKMGNKGVSISIPGDYSRCIFSLQQKMGIFRNVRILKPPVPRTLAGSPTHSTIILRAIFTIKHQHQLQHQHQASASASALNISIISSFKYFWCCFKTAGSIVRRWTLGTWPQNLIYFQTVSKFALFQYYENSRRLENVEKFFF